MRRKVILLQGGFSEEREVSLKTSAAINNALDKMDYETIPLDPFDFPDYTELGKKILSLKPFIVFIGLHGGAGEDGSIQAFLSLLNVPFTGSDMHSSSLCMDKQSSFALASFLQLKIPRYLIFDKKNLDEPSALVKKPGLPLVIKPNSSGSSFGITIVKEQSELTSAIKNAFKYSERIIIQKFVPGSELTVSVLGETPLPVVEIKVKEGWYDYRNKYTLGNTIYEVPAKLPAEITKKLQEESLKLFHAFKCRAYARIDFRYDGQDFYFLEVNTLPGMTSLSLTPMAAEEAGIPFPELIDRIIKHSFI